MTDKLKLPPGIYKNGTEYMAAGRYVDCDLMRWHADALKPVNGWQRRHDFATNVSLAPLWSDGTATEAARSGIVVSDTTAGVTLYIGTNKKIYDISNSNIKTDVTPAGFTAQPKTSAIAKGYGVFRYGFGKYGTARPQPQGRVPNAFSWGFAEWGAWPIAVAREVAAKPVYIKRDTDADFTGITGSPQGVHDVVVTDERFVMTFGTPTDFRLVQWSDRENFAVWAPTVSNQAGSIRLAGVGKLVRGVKIQNQILVLGENDAFSGQYVGPPYVYGFRRIGDSCGIIGPEAVAVTDNFAVWIGGSSFWIFDGTVRQLPCDVLQHYLLTKDNNQRSKTVAFTIADYSEVWFLYQSTQSTTGEPDRYIVYNYAKQCWYIGKLNRTVGIDADPMLYPVMVSAEGIVYDHEVLAAGFDGRIPYAATGPLELDNGSRLMGIQYVYPDEQLDGDVLMELNVRDMPNQPVRYSRQFTLSSPTSTTGIMGRDIRMKLYSAEVHPNWVVGDFRVDAIPGPRR